MQLLLWAGHRLWGNKHMPEQSPIGDPWHRSMSWGNLTTGIADSDPVRPDGCLNVTAMPVLHTTAIAMYPGFPTLDDHLQRIPQTAQTIGASFRELRRAVDALRRDPPEAQYVRVPLDVHRDSIRSLQWYPLTLADLVSSSNELAPHHGTMPSLSGSHTPHHAPRLG